MKKFKLLVLLIGILFLTACANKTAITSDKFISIMEEENFDIVNALEQFSDYDEIKEAYIALEDDGDYQIEFYVLDNDNNAIKLYNHNKEIFEDSKGSVSSYTNVDLNNINKYTLSTNGKFNIVSRIDNTMIYLSVDYEFKDEVIDILKKLGY